MITVMHEDEQVDIPPWVIDLDSFRRWVDADEFPDDGRICYLAGKVWIDMSWEQIFSHNNVKTEYARVLLTLTKAERLGRFFGDGVRLTSVPADFSVVPDGTFVSLRRLRKKEVTLKPGADGGYTELIGSPDMALEVVSRSSVAKDTITLRELYWQAGIREYWLVDVRRGPMDFNIFCHTAEGYVPARKQAAGWLKSAVFGKSFKLTQQKDELGNPEYTLEVR